MASLEEEDSADHEEVCAVLHRQAGKADEVDLCVAGLVEWGLVLRDEVLLLQATITTVKALIVRVLHHVNSRHTVKVIEMHLHNPLWQ